MGTRRLAAAALGAALMVSACADDDPSTGSVDDVPTQAETSEADPGDHEDDDPPADTNNATTAEDTPRDQLEAEAEAFVGRFFQELNNASATGDTSDARSMATEDCNVCMNDLNNIDQIRRDGHRTVGGEFDEELTIDVEHVTGDTIRALVSGQFAALQVVDESGDEVKSFDAAEFTYMLVLVRGDDGNFIIDEGNNYK